MATPFPVLPSSVPTPSPVQAEGPSALARLRSALTIASGVDLSAPADLDQAVLLASLAASLAEVADKAAKAAKASILAQLGEGERHSVTTNAGAVTALVVAGFERRTEDAKAALDAARVALRIAAGQLLQAGRPGESADAASAAAQPAPVKVAAVGPSVRLT